MERTGGRLRNFEHEWQKITNDSEILTYVRGCTIDFDSEPLSYQEPANHMAFSSQECEIIDNEIVELLAKGAIQVSEHEDGEVISPIFLRYKKDGSPRPIINLKNLNSHIVYSHFKMETLNHALDLISEGCWLASLDIKDAYFHVKIDKKFWKYLKFSWKGTLYCFTCLCFGLASAPRIFTKLCKPIVAILRGEGHIIIIFLDDILVIGRTFEICQVTLWETFRLFVKLGFVINLKKSVLFPCQILEYLGYILNTIQLTVTLPLDKIERFRDYANFILSRNHCKIREVARLLGLMTSYTTAIRFGRLFTHHLDIQKIDALKEADGNYDGKMTLDVTSRDDINWWITHLDSEFAYIKTPKPSVTLCTDASHDGWGVTLWEAVLLEVNGK